jgi:hypothetical protein
MPALVYTWSQYNSEGIGYGQMLGAIANGLPKLGYTTVQLQAQDVIGEKTNVVLGVAYLPFSEELSYQVVVCTVDGTMAETKAEHDKVTQMIAKFVFL